MLVREVQAERASGAQCVIACGTVVSFVIEDLLEERLGIADMQVPGEVGTGGMMSRF